MKIQMAKPVYDLTPEQNYQYQKKLEDRRFRWILTAITLIGAIVLNNGWWLLFLLLIWGSET